MLRVHGLCYFYAFCSMSIQEAVQCILVAQHRVLTDGASHCSLLILTELKSGRPGPQKAPEELYEVTIVELKRRLNSRFQMSRFVEPV